MAESLSLWKMESGHTLLNVQPTADIVTLSCHPTHHDWSFSCFSHARTGAPVASWQTSPWLTAAHLIQAKIDAYQMLRSDQIRCSDPTQVSQQLSIHWHASRLRRLHAPAWLGESMAHITATSGPKAGNCNVNYASKLVSHLCEWINGVDSGVE